MPAVQAGKLQMTRVEGKREKAKGRGEEGGRREGGKGGKERGAGLNYREVGVPLRGPGAACASPVLSGLVLDLLGLPTAHQCLFCDSGTSPSPSSAAIGEPRPRIVWYPMRQGLGQGGSLSHWHQKLQTTYLSLPLCVGTIGPHEALPLPPARERKSQDNDLPSPTSWSAWKCGDGKKPQ